MVFLFRAFQAIETSKLTDLSVQQMLDCSMYNRGCQGGDHCLLLQWLQNYNISVATEADYPLSLKHDDCQRNFSGDLTTYIDQFQCNK